MLLKYNVAMSTSFPEAFYLLKLQNFDVVYLCLLGTLANGFCKQNVVVPSSWLFLLKKVTPVSFVQISRYYLNFVR